MLPFKYHSRQIDQILLRNVSFTNARYVLSVETKTKTFSTIATTHATLVSFSGIIFQCPVFYRELGDDFWNELEANLCQKVTFRLNLVEQNGNLKEIFRCAVDFLDLAFIAEDMSKILPNNVPVLAFRISSGNKKEFLTTNETYLKLVAKNLLKDSLDANKRVKEIKDMDTLKQMEKLFQFYGKLAEITILQTKKNQLKQQHDAHFQEIEGDQLSLKRNEILMKQKILAEKQIRVRNLKEKIEAVNQKFVVDRQKQKSEFQQVIGAFQDKYKQYVKTDQENEQRVDVCMMIYNQRLGKSLQDAFQVMFIPELQILYSGLGHVYDKTPFSKEQCETYEQENQISISLGQVVFVTMHLSRILGISLKYGVIYGSNRSFVIEQTQKKTQVLPLFVSQRSDYKTLDDAIKLMKSNLKHILRALDRLRSASDLRNRVKQEQDQIYPNLIITYLDRIAEFPTY